MANVTLLDPMEMKNDERLRPIVERTLKHRAPDPGFLAVMGHNPSLAVSAYTAWMSTFESDLIRHDVKEILRVQLSRLAECNY